MPKVKSLACCCPPMSDVIKVICTIIFASVYLGFDVHSSPRHLKRILTSEEEFSIH